MTTEPHELMCSNPAVQVDTLLHENKRLCAALARLKRAIERAVEGMPNDLGDALGEAGAALKGAMSAE